MTSTPSTTKILSSEFQTKKNNLYNNDSLLSLSPSSPTFSNNTLNHHHNKISYGRKRLLDLYDADVDDDYYGNKLMKLIIIISRIITINIDYSGSESSESRERSERAINKDHMMNNVNNVSGSSSSYISFGRRRLFDFYDYTG